jgi:hypothetical protein
LLADPYADGIAHSARGHEETKRRWVVVLEEVERKSTLGRKLDGLGSASLAIAGGDDVAVAGLDGNIAKVLGDGWCAAVGGLLVGNRAQLAAAEAAGAGHGVVSGGQVLLLREKEDKRALLSGVFCGDVEVEDGAGGGTDLTEVRCALGDVRLLRGDGDDQVRSLIGTSEGGWASRPNGRWRSGGAC